MTGTDHLSDERKIYWKMRSAYEEHYLEAGNSNIGLAITAGVRPELIAENTRRMGILGESETAIFENISTMELDRPAGDIIQDTLKSRSENWDLNEKPIDQEHNIFKLAIELTGSAVDGKVDDTETFKAFLEETEHAIVSSVEKLEPGRAQQAMAALFQVSQKVCADNPLIVKELQEKSLQENDELCSALSEQQLEEGTMDITRMSINTRRHPAEVVGVGLAIGIMDDQNTRHLSSFFSVKDRTEMVQAAQSPEEALQDVSSSLGKEDLWPVGRATLAAANNQMEQTKSLADKAGIMAYSLKAAVLDQSVEKSYALKIIGVQSKVCDDRQQVRSELQKNRER